MPTKDTLGDRMKDYEHRARPMLLPRAWTVIRLDGKAFRTYTRGLDRPYDEKLMADMGASAVALAEQVQGCVLAYQQSDEISLVLYNDNPNGEDWFGGNQQKLVSISASILTAQFNSRRMGYKDCGVPGYRLALFDSRVFTLPNEVEVENYMIWRQLDAQRNAIQMAGQARMSHRELHRVSTTQIVERLREQHGIEFEQYPPAFRHGQVAVRRPASVPVPAEHGGGAVERERWHLEPAPLFVGSMRWWLTTALVGALEPL